MQLHANLLARAVVDTTALPWQASPCPGIDRRMIERDGEEIARATSLVRYHPHSRFGEHLHALGEEVLVLDGEFCDEHGRYPAGTWIKNPAGSRHAPYTEQGCLLLVKLRHLDPEDQERQVLNWHQGTWSPGRAPGVDGQTFSHYASTRTGLVRFAPGASSTRHSHTGGEEIYVISGSYEDEFGHYPTGTWIRSPHGSEHLPHSPEGCVLYIKTGHLPAG